MRLELAGLRPLHLLADPLDVGRRHDLADQRALVEHLAQRVAHRGVDDLV